MTNWLGLPPLASQHGGELDFTTGLIHILMAVLFVGWGAFFAFMLCFDHRVVDGADAIRFLKVITDSLGDPDELLITMI